MTDDALLADLRRIAATVDPEPRLHIVPDGRGGRRIVEEHEPNLPVGGGGEPVKRATRQPKRGTP